MPDYLSVLCVEPERAPKRGAWPTKSDAEHTYDSLLALVEKCKSDVLVLFTSPWDDFSYGVFVRTGAELEDDWSVLSLSASGRLPKTVATTEPLDLVADAGRFVDALTHAAGGREAYGQAKQLWLPRAVADAEALLLVLQFVAPLLEQEEAARIVLVGNAHVQVTLDRNRGVRLDPLSVRFANARGDALARKFFRPAAPCDWRPPLDGKRAAARRNELRQKGDPLGELLAELEEEAGGSALTRGSAQSRADAVFDDEVTAEQLIEALGARANAGRRFESARESMYMRLARRFPGAATAPLLAALPTESPKVRAVILEALSWIDHRDAARPVVNEFLDGSPGPLRDRLGTLVWRQRAGVELLVRRLVAAWKAEPELERRILALVREEYLNIERAWIADAPDELARVLAPHLK